MIDAAHTDPLLTVAELNLDLAAKRVTSACRCVVTPSVSKADAIAALDHLERHVTGSSSAILALRGYLAPRHD
jgi:hypothetical protein